MDQWKFLVIDDNTRSRLLVVATLARTFPRAIITEAATIKEALSAVDVAQLDAVVGFFSNGLDGRVFAGLVRSQNLRVPIVILSEAQCSEVVCDAEPTRFLSCDEWLMVGTVLKEVLTASPTHARG